MPVLNLDEFIETLKREGVYHTEVGDFIADYAGKKVASIYFVPSKSIWDDLRKDGLRIRFSPSSLLTMLRKD